MVGGSGSLQNVLRHELNAVNQQFIHILALREWGRPDAASRIMQVDNIDFPNVMKIIDYCISNGSEMDLDPADFSPGTDYRSILVAEQIIEERLLAAIKVADSDNPNEAKFVQAALSPRKDYLCWLEDESRKVEFDDSNSPRPDLKTSSTVAHLVSLIEQAMIHAFVHWHGGDPDAADDAWATSGAAMMHLTELVKLFAKLPGIPFPSACPSLDIRMDSKDALNADKQLAALCANEASEASAQCTAKPIAELCGNIANDCAAFSNWDTSTPHPAENSNPAAFQSFEITLGKFVH